MPTVTTVPGGQGTTGQVTTIPPFSPGFPNGPALSLQGGIPSFGQNDRLFFSRPFATGGFPAGFPTSGQTTFFGAQGSTFDPRFGFPGQPGVSAGPEFTTATGQTSNDFNIAFQPLPNQPTGPQTVPSNPLPPADLTTSVSDGSIATGNTGFETTLTQTGANNAAITNTITERNVQDGGVSTGGQAGNIVSTSQGGSEFRVVEVGNILDSSGFRTVPEVPTPSSSGNTEFLPSNDINSAFNTLTRKFDHYYNLFFSLPCIMQ